MKKLLIIAALAFVLTLSGCLGWGGGWGHDRDHRDYQHQEHDRY
jgi:hypothetical protein